MVESVGGLLMSYFSLALLSEQFFFFITTTSVHIGNADSPSMTASTAPPAQNSMRICQQVEKSHRKKRQCVFNIYNTGICFLVKQRASHEKKLLNAFFLNIIYR